MVYEYESGTPGMTRGVDTSERGATRSYQHTSYTQDGVLLACVFQGATDGAVFEDFIAQLLLHCGRWPTSNSLLVMDNASFYHNY